jgi:hypothetical protein
MARAGKRRPQGRIICHCVQLRFESIGNVQRDSKPDLFQHI